MDNRPIGVFDSGLGGLTAVKKLSQLLPGEDIVYFGDTGRVPYGSRSRETIIKYTRQDIAFLCSFNIKAVIAACGTVSTTSLDDVAGDFPIPCFGVARAAAVKAASVTKNGKIGLIGTTASIKSGKYEELIHACDPKAEVVGRACPLFVPLVENGRIHKGDAVIETVAREYLLPLREAGVDTLILGCTHYPIIAGIIGEIMGCGVTLVDPGAECAQFLAQRLAESDGLSEKNAGGRCAYYVSDSTEGFSRLASLFLDSDLAGDVKQVSLDTF
ncbi:MAG: glutamate racemase [Oscillospiraceae bacterium]|nr:glutamate racemase [Oscillospiraceae bacterium]